MAKAPTQREMFNRIADFLVGVDAPEDMVEFVEGRIAALDKRAGTAKAPTKGQLANEGVKENIVNVLANANEGMTATAIAKELGMTVQKITALVTQLVKDNIVARDENGKNVTFRLA